MTKLSVHLCLTTSKPTSPILQETHRIGSRILSLEKPWAGHYYHETHSTHERGVSILTRKNLNFHLLDLHLDPKGEYVIMHAVIDTAEMVVVVIYLPPPASVSVLAKIFQVVVQYPTDNVRFAGDFNIPSCPLMDKLVPDVTTDSAHSKWADAFEFYDL